MPRPAVIELPIEDPETALDAGIMLSAVTNALRLQDHAQIDQRLKSQAGSYQHLGDDQPVAAGIVTPMIWRSYSSLFPANYGWFHRRERKPNSLIKRGSCVR